MFKIDSHKSLINDLHSISVNYKELLGDDNPILYGGRNKYGNKILGSIIEDDEENELLWYYHLLVTDEDYSAFINRHKTLRSLILEDSVIFIVAKTYDYSTVEANLISKNDIPEEWLPLSNSYCPTIINESDATFSFGVSLKGKEAEEHITRVSDANSVQINFENVLYNAVRTLELLDIKPQLYLRPAETGSFRINFDVEIEGAQTSIIPLNKCRISSYLKDYFNYLINRLPFDNETSLPSNRISNDIKELVNELKDILAESYIKVSSETVEKSLLDSFNKTSRFLKALDTQINVSDSFERVELLNYQVDGSESSIGTISNSYYDLIKDKLNPIEDTSIKTVEEDNNPTPYRILVYQLNTNTGNGWARLYYDSSEKFEYVRVDIEMAGKSLENSVYTNSLHEGKVVDVVGKAQKIENKYVRLKIQL